MKKFADDLEGAVDPSLTPNIGGIDLSNIGSLINMILGRFSIPQGGNLASFGKRVGMSQDLFSAIQKTMQSEPGLQFHDAMQTTLERAMGLDPTNPETAAMHHRISQVVASVTPYLYRFFPQQTSELLHGTYGTPADFLGPLSEMYGQVPGTPPNPEDLANTAQALYQKLNYADKGGINQNQGFLTWHSGQLLGAGIRSGLIPLTTDSDQLAHHLRDLQTMLRPAREFLNSKGYQIQGPQDIEAMVASLRKSIPYGTNWSPEQIADNQELEFQNRSNGGELSNLWKSIGQPIEPGFDEQKLSQRWEQMGENVKHSYIGGMYGIVKQRYNELEGQYKPQVDASKMTWDQVHQAMANTGIGRWMAGVKQQGFLNPYASPGDFQQVLEQSGLSSRQAMGRLQNWTQGSYFISSEDMPALRGTMAEEFHRHVEQLAASMAGRPGAQIDPNSEEYHTAQANMERIYGYAPGESKYTLDPIINKKMLPAWHERTMNQIQLARKGEGANAGGFLANTANALAEASQGENAKKPLSPMDMWKTISPSTTLGDLNASGYTQRSPNNPNAGPTLSSMYQGYRSNPYGYRPPSAGPVSASATTPVTTSTPTTDIPATPTAYTSGTGIAKAGEFTVATDIPMDAPRTSELPRLLEAKRYSDQGRYSEKVQIILDMMKRNPQDWIVDSPTGKYHGVTHRPHNFRFHMPVAAIPAEIPRGIPENTSIPDQEYVRSKTAGTAPLSTSEDVDAPVREYSQNKNIDEATGIPDRSNYGDLGRIQPGQILDMFRQRHLAAHAGDHRDVRIGDKDGLFSWAMRKEWPKPGEKRMLAQQPQHSHDYGSWEGEIPKGQYGAGKVSLEHQGKILITHASPDKVEFSDATSRFPERYALIRPKNFEDKNWLLVNTTPMDSPALIAYRKIHFKEYLFNQSPPRIIWQATPIGDFP